MYQSKEEQLSLNINFNLNKVIRNNIYTIFTDGACKPNPGEGSWSFIVLDENNKVIHMKSDFVPNTTNNRMEYQALIEALKIYKNENINFYSDSNLLIKMIECYFAKRKSKKKKNLDLCSEIISLFNTKKHKISWVKGHYLSKGNDLADRLCTYTLKIKKKYEKYFSLTS